MSWLNSLHFNKFKQFMLTDFRMCFNSYTIQVCISFILFILFCFKRSNIHIFYYQTRRNNIHIFLLSDLCSLYMYCMFCLPISGLVIFTLENLLFPLWSHFFYEYGLQQSHLPSVGTFFFKQGVILSKRSELISESDLKIYDMRISLDFTNIKF